MLRFLLALTVQCARQHCMALHYNKLHCTDLYLILHQNVGNQCHAPHRLLYTTTPFTQPYSACTVQYGVHYTEYFPKRHCSVNYTTLQCTVHYSAQCSVVHSTLHYSALKCSVVCSPLHCTISYSVQCVTCCTSSPALEIHPHSTHNTTHNTTHHTTYHSTQYTAH